MNEAAPTGLRRIAALDLPHVERAPLDDMEPPRFVRVALELLRVDERYQRNLAVRSVRLIRKIVANWDWRRYKPPVVVEIDGVYHVIDGQHTAIAAATHGGLVEIPVMIVAAADVKERAAAFVGHNRDRVGITTQQIYFAELAAGDDDAQTIHQVCERAGATVLRGPPPRGIYHVGETVAIASIRALIHQHGAMAARQVLEALVNAKCAPIAADLIKAAATIMFAPEYRGLMKMDELSLIVRSMAETAQDEAMQLAVVKHIPLWRAKVILIANKRGRRGSSASG